MPAAEHAVWVQRVHRLAREFARNRVGVEESFARRFCDVCAAPHYVNEAIFVAAEAFSCGDGLYDAAAPLGRDGYWWACCLEGRDPEAPCGAVMRADRRRYLESECAAVGLVFGSAGRSESCGFWSRAARALLGRP